MVVVFSDYPVVVYRTVRFPVSSSIAISTNLRSNLAAATIGFVMAYRNVIGYNRCQDFRRFTLIVAAESLRDCTAYIGAGRGSIESRNQSSSIKLLSLVFSLLVLIIIIIIILIARYNFPFSYDFRITYVRSILVMTPFIHLIAKVSEISCSLYPCKFTSM